MKVIRFTMLTVMFAVALDSPALANGVPYHLDDSWIFVLIGVATAYYLLMSLSRACKKRKSTDIKLLINWKFVIVSLVQVAVISFSIWYVLLLGTDFFGTGALSRMQNDRKARGETRQTSTFVESYWSDLWRYPDAMELVREKDPSGKDALYLQFKPEDKDLARFPKPPDVDITYEKISEKEYRITAAHKIGNREYRRSSLSGIDGIEWRWLRSSKEHDTTTWYKDI